MLLDEIKAAKKEVHLSGSYSALASALSKRTKPGYLDTVPGFVPVWLPNKDKSGYWVENISTS